MDLRTRQVSFMVAAPFSLGFCRRLIRLDRGADLIGRSRAADTFLSGRHSHAFTLQTAGHVALIAVPVLAAEALRNRRSYVRLLLERLEQAERTREEEADRRAEQERLRMPATSTTSSPTRLPPSTFRPASRPTSSTVTQPTPRTRSKPSK